MRKNEITDPPTEKPKPWRLAIDLTVGGDFVLQYETEEDAIRMVEEIIASGYIAQRFEAVASRQRAKLMIHPVHAIKAFSIYLS